MTISLVGHVFFVRILKKMDLLLRYKHVFSKDRPSGLMLSISRLVHIFVCVCVFLSVCSLLRYRLIICLPPLPEVGCPIFFEIRNPCGKEMEGNGLRISKKY